MNSRHAFDLLILGAGFSGVALAIHLLRRAPPGYAVALVDPSPDTGRGRAYADPSGQVLLNVPAGRMSLDPAAPLDFAEWWAAQRAIGVDAVATDFAPRATYGDYVRARWQEALASRGDDVARLHARAIDVEAGEEGFRVALDDGRSLVGRQVVLALGHAPSVLPMALNSAVLGQRLVDPLAPGALESLPREARLLLVGTGLTSVDALGRLETLGHQGRITCVSRHGRWPAVHRVIAAAAAPAPAAASPIIDPIALAASPRTALRHVRAAVAALVREGGDWRAVIDALRPHTAPTWRAWDAAARRQALRHLRSPWDVHRHRMAPAAGAAVERLRVRVDVETRAARIISTGLAPDGGVAVEMQRRGMPGTEALHVDAVLVGLAPVIAPSQRQDPLARALLGRGLVRDDAAGFGFDVDAEGRPLDASGRANPGLYAIGPLLRGRDWETTAVPEIREQALALATNLLAE